MSTEIVPAEQLLRGRRLSAVDRLLLRGDRLLREFTGTGAAETPGYPAADVAAPPLDAAASRHAAGLMRVNHSGEVCAQALYQGQALTACSPDTRAHLLEAAAEEAAHLGWCARRLTELESRPSLLNPLWYAGSLATGALAGLAGDRVSLGFVVETERQVEAHLESHLEHLPDGDTRSRAIVAQMQDDERRHGRAAARAGGAQLPGPVRRAMALQGALMTRLAYWL